MVSVPLPRPKSGAGARNYYLLKALARQHTVSLLAFLHKNEEGVSDDLPLLEACAERMQLVARNESAKRRQQVMQVLHGQSYWLNRFIAPEMQQALDGMLAREHYDAVLFESSLVAGYRVPPGIKVIIDQHNLEHEILQRTYQQEGPSLRKWYNGREYRLVKQGELERCRGADLILVTSKRECLALRQALPQSRIEVVPNGVDIEAFSRDAAQPETAQQVIFTGTMDYYPNTQAALYFAQHCWPRIRAQVPDATWQIIGRDPPPEVQRLAKLPGVTVTGWVPDMRQHLAGAAVAIAPLQIGGGTRLKILEALAMQRAVVSTSLGCEGLELEPGKHVLVADQPEAFAEAVIELLRRPELRQELGRNGRTLVEMAYSWERCGAALLEALEGTLETRGAVCS
ncbi:MAG TPA: glycosyltransferase [Ktedonobacterales bacterium]